MRLLVVVLTAFILASFHPAWARGWSDTPPGDQDWPPIPGNAGMGFFLGTWKPDCDNGIWISSVSDNAHGPMTLHPDGTISYRRRDPTMPTHYRLIETTPYYVVLMTREPSKKYGQILRFWILRPLEAGSEQIGVNECWPEDKDLAGFDWTGSDDETLRRVWRDSATCHPDRKPKSPSGYFLGGGWNQECAFFRPGHWYDDYPDGR